MSATPSSKTALQPRPPRERALLEARLSFARGAMSFPCIVAQISKSGAKLNVGEDAALPDEFDLAIAQRNWKSRARLVWRKGGQAGVKFVEPREEADVATREELQNRIRAMTEELSRLREENGRLRGELRRFSGL